MRAVSLDPGEGKFILSQETWDTHVGLPSSVYLSPLLLRVSMFLENNRGKIREEEVDPLNKNLTCTR